MIKNLLLLAVLIICFASCKKQSNDENPPIKPVATTPAIIESPVTVAYIAVVNASGDTIKSNMVRITSN
jgi:hypothetical protein